MSEPDNIELFVDKLFDGVKNIVSTSAIIAVFAGMYTINELMIQGDHIGMLMCGYKTRRIDREEYDHSSELGGLDMYVHVDKQTGVLLGPMELPKWI